MEELNVPMKKMHISEGVQAEEKTVDAEKDDKEIEDLTDDGIEDWTVMDASAPPDNAAKGWRSVYNLN